MKKNKLIIIMLFLISVLVGCNLSTNSDSHKEIPQKINPEGVDFLDSSITTRNLDDYLFLEDVIYVDLRPYSWVIKEGHVAGFSFYPFYDFIAHLNFDDRLFKMNADAGKVGTIGCFEPNYVESITVLNKLFPKDKYIFVISQGGVESNYFLNLLIQYDYDSSKLYNVGPFGNNGGLDVIAYANLENPKHLVKGNFLIDTNINESFNFIKNLTPIKKEE